MAVGRAPTLLHLPLLLAGPWILMRQDLPNVGLVHPRSDTVNLESSGGGKQYNVRSFLLGLKSLHLVSFDSYYISWDYAMFRARNFPALVICSDQGLDFLLHFGKSLQHIQIVRGQVLCTGKLHSLNNGWRSPVHYLKWI